MIKELLSKEVLQFISDHETDNVEKLLFKYHQSDLPLKFIADQIKGRQKFRSKFPDFVAGGLLFPILLSGEQASSEITAQYKSQLFHGVEAVDLTGGLGIDSLYFSKSFSNVNYIEKDPRLCEFAFINFDNLGEGNITIQNRSAEEFIANFRGKLDLVYADPDRRDKSVRTWSIRESSPDISELLLPIRASSAHWMFKLSPMLDINAVLDELAGIGEVHLISIDNELKELLITSRGSSSSVNVFCVDYIKSIKREIVIPYEYIKKMAPTMGAVSDYIYEPSVTFMKAAGFGYLTSKYNLAQIDKSSHLLSGSSLVRDFPGKKFRVVGVVSPSKKNLSRYLTAQGATISTRNFPEAPEKLRKKFGIPNGDRFHIFFTKAYDKGYVAVITEPVRSDTQS